MNKQPKNWIKQIQSLILQSQEIPMWGSIPSFPWETFSQNLATLLHQKELKITPGQIEWKKGSEILEGLGASPCHIHVELSPLKGSLSFLFPSEDLTTLSSWLIHPNGGKEGFSNIQLQKGFFCFLCLEALRAVDELKLYHQLSPKLVEMPLSEEDAYSIDIAITRKRKTLWGRLICPTIFHAAFQKHFIKDWNFTIPSTLYEQIEIPLSLTLGKTTLDQENLHQLKKGDFLLLDEYSYSLDTKKGVLKLCLEEIPLFQVKCKDEGIKILDYAVYYEENPMDKEYEETEETLEENEEIEGEGEEEDIGEEEGEEAEAKNVPFEPIASEKLISPKKVPISVTIEVTKIKMNLDKLLKLKPGNILELSVKPENGISLTVQGKCIGKGELVQVGEVLGVQITEIG